MTTTPMPELNEDQQRTEFEATEQGSDLARLWGAPELYANPCVENRWQGWLKARRASSAQQVEAVSIDSRQLHDLIGAYVGKVSSGSLRAAGDAYRAIIHHIDARLRQAATGSADGLDAKRYRIWRDAMVSEDEKLFELIQDAMPHDKGQPRKPTADEWDAVLDAAILAQQGADKP